MMIWRFYFFVTHQPQLPLLASTAGDILEVFLIKHSLICGQFGRCQHKWRSKIESQFLWTSPFFRFSFASKTFRPEQEKKSTQSPARTIGQETTSLVFTIFHDYDLIYEITMEVIGFIFIWCLPSIMSLSWSWCQLSLQSFIIWHWLRLSLSSRRLKPRARELSWGVVMPPRSSTR